MKLRNKITFLFTAVVSAILLLLCIAVYYFSSLSRVSDFRKRLKVRAVTTVKLLVNNDDGINKEQLRRLDEKTFTSLPQKNIIVIKDDGTVEYNYVDDNTSAIKITTELLSKASSGDDYYFSVDNKDAIIIKESNYYSIAASYDADGYGRLHTLAVILEICFVSGIALTFLSGYFFSFRIVYPIKKISAEVHDISSQNLSRRIPVSNTKDELNELSVTFNDLLTRLQESFEIQKRFIANASHELSTPLTSISSQVEITLQNERSANEYKEVLQSVYEDVRNLTELTRGLLALAKASGTSGGIELSSVRIDELLMRLPAELKTVDPQYSVDLHFDNFPEDENLFHVFGNSDLLHSAIKNVVMNACKYSDDKAAKVYLHFNSDNINIVVADNGPVINQDELGLIFQPFYRSNNAIQKQGFGLGLSLALRIIKLHKGDIHIKSANNYTVCNITLPLANLLTGA